MQIAHKGRVVDPARLSDGALFLTDFGGGPIVRAMKAFHVHPSGIYAGKIVTVGPFRDEGEGQPGVYEPSEIRRPSVVDITATLAFAYSLDPDRIALGTPSARECVGLAIIVEDKVFLGCRFYRNSQLWEPAYLNMKTGEIVFDVNAVISCVTKEWYLQPLDES